MVILWSLPQSGLPIVCRGKQLDADPIGATILVANLEDILYPAEDVWADSFFCATLSVISRQSKDYIQHIE